MLLLNIFKYKFELNILTALHQPLQLLDEQDKLIVNRSKQQLTKIA
jgi:hypothetical protein